MNISNRSHLKAKISKSNEIFQAHHVKRTLSDKDKILSAFYNKVSALQNQLNANQEVLVTQMNNNPASITQEQRTTYELSVEHHKKLEIVANASLTLKLRMTDLQAKYSPEKIAHRVHEGISILNNIIDTVNNIYTAKADILTLQNMSNHFANNKKLTKEERKFLNKLIKNNPKLTKAETLNLIAKDLSTCKEYVARGEAVIKKHYKNYFENIIDVDLEKQSNKIKALQEQKPVVKTQAEVENKAMINIYKYIDSHLAEQAEVLKSLLKGPIASLDNRQTPPDYWENTDNIVKFLKLISTQKFKFHFKSLVNDKFEGMKTALESATAKEDKRTNSEVQSSAVRSVMSEYGIGKETDPMVLVKLIDPLFKEKEELRSHLANQLEQYSKAKDKPIESDAPAITNINPEPKSEDLANVKIPEEKVLQAEAPEVVTAVEMTKSRSLVKTPPLPGVSKNICALFSPKPITQKSEGTRLVSTMVEKLGDKVKELTSSQQNPALSPQLKKHNSGHIYCLKNTIVQIQADSHDLNKVRDLVSSEIQDRYHVNVVIRNILETFVKQTENFLKQGIRTGGMKTL